ncbi:MAG: hypothetical protein ACOY0T_03860 [Myxococcota bacterium]
MSRIISLLNAGLFTLALALPAAAAPRDAGSTTPSCDHPKGDKKDEKKNPSVAEAQCDGPKTDSKGDKKNPSVAEAQCDGPKTDSKGDKKNPSTM